MLQGKILCRDCVTLFEAGSRCPACFSPRLVSHPEHSQLAIAHVDCDAFYAAIEKRDNPALRDKPVIVGGGKRGVVATCCYIARIFGVRSAMPMFKALKLCPDAVVVKPSMEKYAAAARDVRAKMQALTPLVEPLSIDEAFLDLNGTGRLHGMPPSAALAKFAGEVESDIGISVSIGLSHNKFLAKIASEGRGVVVLLNCGESADQLLAQFNGTAQPSQLPGQSGRMDLRTYGIGAQILRECGVRKMMLLGSPRRSPGLTGYGLEVVGYVNP